MKKKLLKASIFLNSTLTELLNYFRNKYCTFTVNGSQCLISALH